MTVRGAADRAEGFVRMAMPSVRKEIKAITDDLVRELSALRFNSPVEFVYNPLDYARKAFDAYLAQCDLNEAKLMMLGMNPGPWGMAQTGVPFGEVGVVRDWLGINAPIGKPAHEHPKRPILGLQCQRSEVSGARLWGWARDTYKTPKKFLRRFFVCNYCPLIFLEDSGRNRTPDKLPIAERTPIIKACDRALQRTAVVIAPRMVIGVGAFATRRAAEALEGMKVRVGGILHPSPASPIANRGWARQAHQQLMDLGVRLPKR